MDFPKNAPTNVHKIDGVLFIRWSVYGIEDVESAATDETPGFILQPFDALSNVEYEFRRTGGHVLHDETWDVLWHFDLSGPTVKKDGRDEIQDGTSTLLRKHGLSRLSSGSLRAADIGDLLTSNQPFKNTSTPLEMMLLKQGSPNSTRKHRKGAPEVSQDNLSVYSHIMSALRLSISFFLSRTDHYVPLSPNFILSPKLGRSHSLEYGRDDYHDPLAMLCLEIQWLQSGTLLIYAFPEPQPLWWTLRDYRPRALVDTRTAVKLAPFGANATIVGETREVKGAFRKAEESINLQLKTQIALILKRRGFQLQGNCLWLQVNVLDSAGYLFGDESNTKAIGPFLWPSYLCFCQDDPYMSTRTHTPWLWPGIKQNAIDPLEVAETWQAEKALRDENIDQKRREREEQSRIDLHKAPSDNGDFDVNSFSAINRQIEVQGMSGIYPTPPDGFRSHAPGNIETPDVSDPANHCDDITMMDGTESGDHETGQDCIGIDTFPDVGMSLGTYENLQEDEDLFVEMDSAMFTAKGITEDDFDFFDEPGYAEQAVYSASADKGAEAVALNARTAQKSSSSEPQAEDNNEIRVVHEVQRPSSDQDHLASGNLVQHDSEIGPHVTTPHHPDSPDFPTLSPFISLQEREDNFEYYPSQSITQGSPEELAASRIGQEFGSRKSAFDHLPHKKAPQKLDQKYTDHGRFFFENDSYAIPNNRESQSVSKAVPILGRHSSPNSASSNSENGSDTDTSSVLNTSLLHDENHGLDELTGTDTISEAYINPEIIDKTVANLQDPAIPQTGNDYMRGQMTPPAGSPMVASDFYIGHDDDFIQIAQLVSDQLITSVNLEEQETHIAESDLDTSFIDLILSFEDPLRLFAASLFPHSESCTLESFVIDSDYPGATTPVSKAGAKPAQKRHDSARLSADTTSIPSIVELPCPNVRVLRGDTVMDISATALRFWEELGLSPPLGPKNITAFCVYPHTEMIKRGSASFLDMLSTTYQSLRLGTHTAGDSRLAQYEDGLVQVGFESDDMIDTCAALNSICASLGIALSQLSSSGQTIVVYIVNPFCPLTSLPWLCSAFLKCFGEYASSLSNFQKQEQPSDLVLKIIPICWVASTTTVALPSPKEYIRMAQDIYDRCPGELSYVNKSPYASASMVQLAGSVPKTLNFRLSTDPTANLIHDGRTLHVAYAWNLGSEWLCSSITDSLGSLVWNASYSFGHNTLEPWSTFVDIVKEMWQGILDMIGKYSKKRLIYIVKDEPMDQKEIDAWTSLSTSSEQQYATVILVYSDACPPIYYSNDRPFLPRQEVASLYATPVSTPIASASTPDNMVSPGLPIGSASIQRITEAFDIDANARLLDVIDQTWAFSSARAFHTTKIRNRMIFSLQSGYLLKRSGVKDENGWIMMGVHILRAEKWTDASMKDLLTMYRALGTVARNRGVENNVKSVLPLHIATARKAQQGLTKTMRFGGI